MLKENRLKKNWQFQSVINSKHQIVSKYLVIYYLPNNAKTIRIGISISKKFLGAVGRNYQRRQVRSIVRTLPSSFFEKSFDIVLILRKPFLELDFKTKGKVVKSTLERL